MKIKLAELREAMKGKRSYLQDKLVDLELYELDLSALGQKQEELTDDENLFASWTKAVSLNTTQDGLRSPGFHRGFYQTMMSGLDLALEALVGDTGSVMQFLPGGCTNLAASLIADIARSELTGYDVVLLNGDNTTNAEAEQLVLDQVEVSSREGRKVWIISANMGSRSFSVAAIQTVLLTFDGGGLGSMLQKISRALTAGEDKAVGRVVSYSLDPNREDKAAAIILDTATKLAERLSIDLEDAIKRAYATIPLFTTDEYGCKVKLTESEYIEKALCLTAALALSVNKEQVFNIELEDAQDLLDTILKSSKRTRLEAQPALAKGKKFIDKAVRGHKADPDELQSALNALYAQLDAFVHNLYYLRYFIDKDVVQLSDILEAGEVDATSEAYFLEVATMTPQTVRKALDLGLIRRAQVDAALLKYSVK